MRNSNMNGQPSEKEEDSCVSIIKEIDRSSISFIAAGEKINDIEIAIRELIENSVDAGAKNIEIRLARYGIDAVEVEDNGSGIDEKDFGSLCMRYHTSKVQDYKSLQESLETFGFRGEALSCLCTIANVTVTTKSNTSRNGWKLVFDKDGKITKQEPIGRSNGTTVIIKNIFHSLPVRRRELEVSAKKQYDKVVKLIYEQVLARPSIKFSLCKKNAAKKEKDFTHGGSNLEGCIITMFGIKMLESLMKFRQTGYQFVPEKKIKLDDSIVQAKNNSEHQEHQQHEQKSQDKSITQDKSLEVNPLEVENATSDTCAKFEPQSQHSRSLQHAELALLPIPTGNGEFFKRKRNSKFARERPDFKIDGYISKIGFGRNSTDCQFLFVNNKPCDIAKLTRLINEIYKGYSKDQYPFFCLFVRVQNWAADFNVPRKRAVILQEEAKLRDIVRESLEEMYSSSTPASQTSCPEVQMPLISSFKMTNGTDKAETYDNQDQIETKSDDNVTNDVENATFDKLKQEPLERLKNGQSTLSSGYFNVDKSEKLINLTNGDVRHTAPIINEQKSVSSEIFHCQNENKNDNSMISSHAVSIPDPFEHGYRNKKTPPKITRRESSPVLDEVNSSRAFRNGLDVYMEEIGLELIPSSTTTDDPNYAVDKRVTTNEFRTTPQKTIHHYKCRFDQQVLHYDHSKKLVKIEYIEDLAVALERERSQRKVSVDRKEFSFAIHPKFNSVAEEQLKLNLNKKSFQDMLIIGQFNKGFIITCLNNHLFIIDQHATDERANYEDLLEKSPIEKQVMVHPKPLFLNLIQENAILNNLEAFVTRGFEFIINKENLMGYRIMLSSTSICKGVGKDEFLGKEDVDELIDVILESPNRLESYTLKKVREVAASKACRKSVMIRDTLTWQKMSSIVQKMSSLKNPWVCAHNRPTIRHLLEMDADWIYTQAE